MRTGPPRRLAGLAALLLMATLGAACRSVPPTHYYVLERAEARPLAEEPATPEALYVAVEALDVEPPYDQERIVYRPPGANHEIAFYHYHRWAAEPGRLLSRALGTALERRAGLVIAAAGDQTFSDRRPDVVVNGTVRRLEEVDGANGDVTVRLDLDLLYSGTRNGALALRLESAASAPTLEAVVAAFADAVEQAAAALSERLGPEAAPDY